MLTQSSTCCSSPYQAASFASENLQDRQTVKRTPVGSPVFPLQCLSQPWWIHSSLSLYRAHKIQQLWKKGWWKNSIIGQWTTREIIRERVSNNSAKERKWRENWGGFYLYKGRSPQGLQRYHSHTSPAYRWVFLKGENGHSFFKRHIVLCLSLLRRIQSD